MADALVLAGAVSQGAFAAGALAEFCNPWTMAKLNLDVRRIVATSSGSLNGAFLARSLREGNVCHAVPQLEDLWLKKSGACDVFDFSLGSILHGRGLSTARKLRALLEASIRPSAGANPVELSVVVTNLDGDIDLLDSRPATTYERCIRFEGDTFDSAEKLSPLFDAVVASAAFPVLFEPATLRRSSANIACIDGGVCNDTPVGYALENAPGIDRIFVIAPFPRVRREPRTARGVSLITELAQILIEERLFRDLQEAGRVNLALTQLERWFPAKSTRARILEAIGWTDRRVVQIVEVRPPTSLEGDVFSGFVSQRIRSDYLRAGHEAAREVVGALGDT